MPQYDKTRDSLVENLQTKENGKIICQKKRKTCSWIGDILEVFKKTLKAAEKKSGSFWINCIVSIQSGKVKLCSVYVQHCIMSQYDKTDDCGNPEDKSTRQNYLEENPEKTCT